MREEQQNHFIYMVQYNKNIKNFAKSDIAKKKNKRKKELMNMSIYLPVLCQALIERP